jgi:hypothetical protein
MLPTLRKSAGATPEEFQEVQKQVYMLFLRCIQGGLMDAWPKEAILHLGVPDPSLITDSLGNERDYFESFLKDRCDWTQRDVSRSVRPFPSGQALIWAQDVGEIVERPGSSLRTVYHSSTDEHYDGFV